MKHTFTLLTLLILTTGAFAQPANDECADAVDLPDQISYCSGVGTFTNTGATPSQDFNDSPVCFEEIDETGDVWFRFVARRNSVTINVTGDTDTDPGGTLRAPQFALYDEGICDDLALEPIGCRSPFEDPLTGRTLNGGSLIYTDLQRGQTYFIQVSARFGNRGSFRLCVDQFDEVAAPSGDCATGVILCDKSPFSVPALTGTGNVIDDIDAGIVSCGGEPEEFNAVWYKWTCETSGDLTFTIDPLGAAFNEDIDFVVFEYPDGLDGCNTKNALRWMFSGETRGNGDDNIPCLGETGLSAADPDTQEDCGCQPGNNNFVSAIDMVAGRSYGVVIMNFSGSGDGFAIEFGGSGTFLGPEPSFSFSSGEVCVGETLTFVDESQSVDPIISREWDFGPTANPRTATGPGPHDVVFTEPGQPDVAVIIETERECREIFSRREVNVICCTDQFEATGVTIDVTCPGDSSGTIDLTATSNFSPATIRYAWSNDLDTEDIGQLGPGQYAVTISDASGCETVREFVVDAPPAYTFDTLIGRPDCAGGTNGSLEFTVTGGGTPGYEYSLNGGPFSNDNRLDNLPVTTVNVVATDAAGCRIEQDIEVDELELGLRPGLPTFTEPTCNGDSDGSVIIQIANGQRAYEYDFGGGFQPDSVLRGLSAGVYAVTARDATGCLGEFTIDMTEPPILDLDLVGISSTCFETMDGTLTGFVNGGRPGYAFTWSDAAFPGDSARVNVGPGNYVLSVTDDNGCVVTDGAVLTDPDEIVPFIEDQLDLICFGDSTGNFTLGATGGTPDYVYSADGINFQTDSLLAELRAGNYLLYVMDANGCVDSVAGALTEPEEFIIQTGLDGTLALGYDTVLTALSNYDPVVYSWGPDSVSCLNENCSWARVGPVFDTEFLVVGTNAAGCIDSASVFLKVVEDKPVYIPSAFSPNGDGVNDGFTLFGNRAVAGIDELSIYDRWGEQVFGRSDFPAGAPELGWDGTFQERPMNPAVFVYHATVRFVNGSTTQYSGEVTLVR